MSDTNPYDGQERRRSFDEQMLRTVVLNVMEAMPKPEHPHCLTGDEQQWVRLAIQAQVERAALRKAVIEKTLAGLVWSAVVGFGYVLIDYLKAHGWK